MNWPSENLHSRTQPSLRQRFDDRSHADHGRREQGRHRDDLRVLLARRGDEFFRADIRAEVGHFEAAAFEHRGNESPRTTAS